MDTQFWENRRHLYRETLLQNIVPFWMRHGFDSQYGGIGNVLDDAGNPVGYDKFFWSQGRALWTFSALCRRVEPRAEWLDFARHIAAYLRTHGRDSQGRWMFRLDPNGAVLDADTSIYVDGFVLRGLAEFYAATGEEWALELALETWENALERLARPGSYGVAPYEIPTGLKTHGVAMIFSYFGFDLGEIADRNDIKSRALGFADEILSDFYNAEHDAILEYVTLDGQFSDTPPGRACVPGHAIEALWFLISIFERAGQTDKIPLCCRLILRHLELGWDDQFGGLRLALDIKNQTPLYWQRADCKPWWVQVEALVATSYAASYGCDWAQEWHEKVGNWAWERYPVPTGEWRQWLERDGTPAKSAALPVKDPFHLPRALLVMDEVLGRRLAP